MTIRSKFILITALAILLPFAAVSFFLTQRPIQRFSNSNDKGLKTAALAAGEVYNEQEAVILQGALDAAQRIGSSALFEMLQVMRPVPGAASRPGIAPANQPERAKPLA